MAGLVQIIGQTNGRQCNRVTKYPAFVGITFRTENRTFVHLLCHDRHAPEQFIPVVFSQTILRAAIIRAISPSINRLGGGLTIHGLSPLPIVQQKIRMTILFFKIERIIDDAVDHLTIRCCLVRLPESHIGQPQHHIGPAHEIPFRIGFAQDCAGRERPDLKNPSRLNNDWPAFAFDSDSCIRQIL